MNVVGVIAEFNPYHNGHQYLLDTALQRTNSKHSAVIMSGDFVQRGEPAVCSKYLRAKSALYGGFDVVLLLPVIYCAASAEQFAYGAVSILEYSRSISHLAFGIECDSNVKDLYSESTINSRILENLELIADILENEPAGYKTVLKDCLKSGCPFPLSRQYAVTGVMKQTGDYDDILTPVLLNKPNNILAIEYIRSLKRLKSSIVPLPVLRKSSFHNDTAVKPGGFSSAKALRNIITDDYDYKKLSEYMPDRSLSLIHENHGKSLPVDIDMFSDLLSDHIYRCIQNSSLTEYLDMSKDLANRLGNIFSPRYSFKELAKALKSKQYTYTRIIRTLTHVLLNIPDNIHKTANPSDLYIRLLGIKKQSPLLSLIGNNASIPVISRPYTDADKLSEKSKAIYNYDVYASFLYDTVIMHRYGYEADSDCKKQIVVM